METRDKLLFVFVAFSTVVMVILNIFIGMTIYTQGDTLIHSTGSAQDISTGMGYIMYILGVLVLNSIVLLSSVFMMHYKLWCLQRDAESENEWDF